MIPKSPWNIIVPIFHGTPGSVEGRFSSVRGSVCNTTPRLWLKLVWTVRSLTLSTAQDNRSSGFENWALITNSIFGRDSKGTSLFGWAHELTQCISPSATLWNTYLSSRNTQFLAKKKCKEFAKSRYYQNYTMLCTKGLLYLHNWKILGHTGVHRLPCVSYQRTLRTILTTFTQLLRALNDMYNPAFTTWHVIWQQNHRDCS